MGPDAVEQRLAVDDGELCYRSSGDGPVVVLAHAFGPLAWGDVARLAETCTVVVPDWEASTLDLRTQITLAWFEPLVRALGHRRGTLCAWSMSGPAAIWFAADEPPALSRLVLVDVAGLCDVPPLRWRDLWHVLAMRVLGRPTRGFARMLWRGWVWRDDLDTRALEDATLRFFRDNANAFGTPGAATDDDVDDDGDDDGDEELIDELASIAAPTLVLVGRHSQVLGPDHGREATARLPRGELVVFEQSGHALQLEEPERFQRVLSRFVREGRD